LSEVIIYIVGDLQLIAVVRRVLIAMIFISSDSMLTYRSVSLSRGSDGGVQMAWWNIIDDLWW